MTATPIPSKNSSAPPRLRVRQKRSVTRGLDAEKFIWDGLALVHRDGSDYLNEPSIGGGNPVASNGKVMLNDMLGNTVAVKNDEAYCTTSMTAFGESTDSGAFFTGKPFVGELGYAFLMRSYRPENGKWQTADPMGYPDGWNQLAYCNNGVTSCVDLFGAELKHDSESFEFNGYTDYYKREIVPPAGARVSTTGPGYTKYAAVLQADWTGSGWKDKAVATPYEQQNGFTVSYGTWVPAENNTEVWIECPNIASVSYTTSVSQPMPVVYEEYVEDKHDGYLTYYLKATLTIQEGITGVGYSAFSSIENGAGRVVLTVSARVKKE